MISALDTVNALDNDDFLDATEADWDRTMNVNAKGVFLCGQAVARHMIERGIKGCIINTSSVTSLVGITTGNANYAATNILPKHITADASIVHGANVYENWSDKDEVSDGLGKIDDNSSISCPNSIHTLSDTLTCMSLTRFVPTFFISLLNRIMVSKVLSKTMAMTVPVSQFARPKWSFG